MSMDREPLPTKRPGGKRATPKPAPSAGVELAVSALIDSLELDADHHRRSLAAMALTLAKELDAGAGMASAAMVKELRATLHELGGEGADDDDAFAQWERSLANPG
jgi:hypothetical protein